MGISKPAGLKSPRGEVKSVNPLFVGIDVSSKNNVAYLMKPDGSKHSSFSVQNNLGGAKLLSERIVSALSSMRLSDVVIGLEATSIYGDNLVYALREDGGLGRFRRYYDLKFKEVNKYQHKRALALTARKLVRLVFRLLKDNRLYIPPEG